MYGGNSSVLSREQERELIARYQSGDKRALGLLVQHNQRFIYKVVRPIAIANNANMEDALQEGTLGFIRAVEKFEPERGFKLISYAANWIRAYAFKYALEKVPLVRASGTQAARAAYFKITQVRKALTKDGVEPTDEQMMNALGLKEDVYWAVVSSRQGALSLDAPVAEDGEGTASHVDMIEDPLPLQDEQLHERRESFRVTNQIETIMNTVLDERERDIIKSRHMDDSGPTLMELGVKYDCSRERIRQLEMRSLDKLKRALEGEYVPPKETTDGWAKRKRVRRKKTTPPEVKTPVVVVRSVDVPVKPPARKQTTFEEYRTQRIAELQGKPQPYVEPPVRRRRRKTKPLLAPQLRPVELVFCDSCKDLMEDVGRKYCSWKCRRAARVKHSTA